MKTDYPNSIRRATLDRVAISLLRNVNATAVGEFYRCHIVEIMQIIEAKTNKVSLFRYYFL